MWVGEVMAMDTGRIYGAMGLLSKGHVLEVGRSDLVAKYIGQTGPQTKEFIEKARGGVLFIDEAYALSEGKYKEDFGKEAVAIITKFMEDNRGNFALIVAGYPHNMDDFIETNPGLESRFDQTYIFSDFSEEELYQIAVKMLDDNELYFDKKASAHIKRYIQAIFKSRDRYFGNARTMRKIAERAKRNQNLRPDMKTKVF